MKNNKLKMILLFVSIMILSCEKTISNKETSLKEDQGVLAESMYSSPKSIFLYGIKASIINGDLEVKGGNYMAWKGDAQLVWDIEVPKEDIYEVYLIANVQTEGDTSKLVLKANGKNHDFILTETKGPFKNGLNFERIKLPLAISLKEGKQQISLFAEGISKDLSPMDFRSIELLPISKKNEIIKEERRAISSRSNIDLLTDAGYGIMFHWTSQSVQPDGTIKKFEDAVNDFDVEQFTNMVDDMGAGYVIFTIGHAESYCPAPIKSWENIHVGKTTKRDLIAEMAESLNKKGIGLLCYINGPLAFEFDTKKTPTEAEKQAFVTNFKEILTEMGNRYQDQIAGYWFDSWYQIFQDFQNVPFEAFYKATKIGYKDRITCLNSWIYPAVTPWQDYWAGEIASPIELPKNGFMQNGPVPDIPYHALLTMEKYMWVQQKAVVPEPKYNAGELTEYIQNCMKNGGIVTINLGIYQNGKVGEKALQVMKDVKKQIRN